MIHIVKILAPVDLSSASKLTSLYAVQLARVFGAELIFLYVIPEFSLAAKLFFPQVRPLGKKSEVEKSEEKEAREKLKTFLKTLPLEGVRYSERVEKGVPFLKILQAVETLHPTVVVQGTHGATGLESLVIGGTAERVIRKTRCPVISIKPGEFGSFLSRTIEGGGLVGEEKEEAALTRKSYNFPPQKVLYPTDFSEPSRLAMDYALYVAERSGAELIVIHATDEKEGAAKAEKSRGPEVSEHPTAQEQMEALVREMQALYDNIRVTSRIVRSRPTSAILSITFREEIDMVIMGTHGRTDLGIMLAGSNSDHVIRNAPCPVLTIRPNWKMEEVEKKFRKIYRKLSPMDLQRISSEHQAFIDEKIFRDPAGFKKTDLLLNYYSREGMTRAFEEYGILKILRKKGFDDFIVAFNVDDPYRQLLRVYYGGLEEPENLLVELILREGVIRTRDEGDGGGGDGNYPILIIEWLCLQHPRTSFGPERTPLPGQSHPGLGIGHEMLEFLVVMGLRLKKAGLMNRPQYYHNARFYHEKFKFYNPVREGQLVALIRDTGDYGLTDVTWAIHHGCLRDRRTRKKVIWEGDEQVYPFSDEFTEYFRSRNYQDLLWETVGNTRYRIDWKLFRRRMEKQKTPLA